VRAVLVAALLSGLAVVAWVILIVTTPSDPQIGLAYIFTTLYAVLALVAIWATAGVIAVRHRRKS
jgi:hypothetical protein